MSNSIKIRVSLALRNLLRHRSRTAATLAAIGVGVACMILAGGFVKDIFFQLGESTIHSQTGHIQLARQGYWAARSRTSDSYMIGAPDEIKKKLTGLPGLDQLVARVNFVGMLNNGKRDLGIIGDGIEPDSESKIGTFLHYSEGRALTNDDLDGMVIGQGIAKSLNLKINDHITLVVNLSAGAINTMDFRIIGVFQSFSKEFDARAVRIPLHAAQDLLDTQAAHLLVMTLQQTTSTNEAANLVTELLQGQNIEVKTWKNLSDFYEKTVQLYDAQFGVLRLIISLMVLLSVANSVNMTVYERTREFGTLLALGDRRQTIVLLIMTEAMLLGLIGAILGVAFGCFSGWLISAIGIEMPPPPNSNIGYMAMIRLEPVAVTTSGAIGFFAAFLASVFPARRTAKVNIVDSLRHGV